MANTTEIRNARRLANHLASAPSETLTIGDIGAAVTTIRKLAVLLEAADEEEPAVPARRREGRGR